MGQMAAAEIERAYADALNAQKMGRRDEALAAYQRIIEENPSVAEAYYQAGRILTDKFRFEPALQALFAAAELRPTELPVWLALAEAVALGGGPASEQKMLNLLKSPSVPVQIRIRLQDRFGRNRRNTRPAMGGVKPEVTGQMVKAMRERRYPEAERMALATLRKHPGSAMVLNILASAQAAQGRSDQAEKTFHQAIRTDPAYAEAYDNLGGLYQEKQLEEQAFENFRRAVILAPGLPTALISLASLYTSKAHPESALVLLARAQADGVNSAPLFMALGNAHTRMREFFKAEEAFEQALQLLGGRSAKALGLLGQSQARQGKDDLALKNFEQALQIDPNSVIATGGKASLLQTLGDFGQASELYRRVFDLDPHNGENYRLFIVSHKTAPGDPVLELMLERFKDPAMPELDRMNLAFAIAKALDDIKDDQRSFEYLNIANTLMRKMAPYQIEQRLKQVEQTKELFADFDWHGARIDGTTDFAPIFVTGMPRSGTTLIEQIIASHSSVTGTGELGECVRAAQLIMTGGKVARHMADVTKDEIVSLGTGFEDYVGKRFPGSGRITDKSIQTYMYMGLIKLAMPMARFIIVRREPRDNLLSLYKNKFPDDTHLYAYDQRDLAIFYGTFVEMIDFWRERVPDWFYEVQYEELVANPEVEARKLIAACGLDWEDACLNFHENKRKVETLSVFQVRQPITKSSVKGWKRFEKDLAPMLDELRKRGLVTD